MCSCDQNKLKYSTKHTHTHTHTHDASARDTSGVQKFCNRTDKPNVSNANYSLFFNIVPAMFTTASVTLFCQTVYALKIKLVCLSLHCKPSKSYLTPPRWRGLGNGSTPVSHHITTRLRRVDENVDPAKLGRLCSAFPHLGFGVPCWCGVGRPCPGVFALLVAGFVRWVSI